MKLVSEGSGKNETYLYNKDTVLHGGNARQERRKSEKRTGTHLSPEQTHPYLKTSSGTGSAATDNFGFFLGGDLLGISLHLNRRFTIFSLTSLRSSLQRRTTHSLGAAAAEGPGPCTSTGTLRIFQDGTALFTFGMLVLATILSVFRGKRVVGISQCARFRPIFRSAVLPSCMVATVLHCCTRWFPPKHRAVLWSDVSTRPGSIGRLLLLVLAAPTRLRIQRPKSTPPSVFGMQLNLLNRPNTSCWLRSALITSLLFDSGDEMTSELSAAVWTRITPGGAALAHCLGCKLCGSPGLLHRTKEEGPSCC